MGKTAGYAREYRARRKANNGAPLGRATGGGGLSSFYAAAQKQGLVRGGAKTREQQIAQLDKALQKRINLQTRLSQQDLGYNGLYGRGTAALSANTREINYLSQLFKYTG